MFRACGLEGRLKTPTFAAAILLSATMRGARESLERVVAEGPEVIVSIGEELQRVPTVLANGEAGVFQAVAHLVTCHKRRQIAFIAAPDGSADGAQRLAAYRSALDDFAIPYDRTRVIQGDFEALSGREAVRRLQRTGALPFDAIVAANDLMAIGAIEELRAQGVQVPRDVSIIGFDDLEEASYITPTLTTVRQPVHEQGAVAAGLIVKSLRGEGLDAESSRTGLHRGVLTVPTPLVVRRSCGCRSVDAKGEPPQRGLNQDRSVQELLEDALRRMIRRELAARRVQRELSSAAETILGARAFTDLAPVLTSVFHLLNLKRFLVCVYESGGQRARVVLESRGSDVVASRASLPFPIEQLLPAGSLKPEGPVTLTIEPLSLVGEQFGYMVVEGDAQHTQSLFDLRQYLSGALGRIARTAPS